MTRKQILMLFTVFLLTMVDKPDIMYAKQVQNKISREPLTVLNTKNKNTQSFQTVKPLSRKEIYSKNGYEDFKSAIKKFENHHDERIQLPQEKAFKATVKYGKYYSKLDLLKLYWGTDNTTFQINITSVPTYRQQRDKKSIQLENGVEAYLTHSPNNDGIEFTKDGLYYHFLTYKQGNIPIQQIEKLAATLKR